MERLYDKLYEYGNSDHYPYHMPGHKRRLCGNMPKELFEIDITEIDGFDNLHASEEILQELQENAARICGAEESFFLVNGSTCGILSAISAVLPKGGHLLMARNSHRSAYHGVYQRELKASYLYPSILEPYGICDVITPEQVQKMLDKSPDIGAVFIVSPTYEGRIADIAAIAKIAPEQGIPLIVDEAHGAHLGLAEGFPVNSSMAGADLVIQSVHKTLPAMTQTALLHVNGSLVDRDRLRRFLHIYQSSSPSYVLMAGIDNALRIVEEQGEQLFTSFKKKYTAMHRALTAGCKVLRFIPLDERKQDIGKLVIDASLSGISGRELYDILREKYHLQLEMAAENYCLAMFTIADTDEGYARMQEALLEIDGELAGDADYAETGDSEQKASTVSENEPAPLPLSRAWDMEAQWVGLRSACGRIAADFVNLYPPGVPLLVPGERITEELIATIRDSFAAHLNVQGVDKAEDHRIKVIL